MSEEIKTPSVFQTAQRSKAYLKLGISSVSGGGKTMGAILMAKGLVDGDLSKVAFIDTENESANLYSHLGPYQIVPFAPPFHPHRFVTLIEMAEKEGFECLIIDSTSHEWEGEGGILKIHAAMPGNSFTNWNKVNPLHDAFLKAILQSKLHIICCMRRKQDHVQTQKGGRTVIEKMGLREIQRDGFEYELTLNLEVSQEHMAISSKDRTGLFPATAPFMISEETGKTLREWNEGS